MKKIEKQFEDYINYCTGIRRMSPKTVCTKKWVCKSLLLETNITDIQQLSNSDVLDWIALHTRRGCTGRTINARIIHLVAMLHYFQDMGLSFPNLQIRMITKVNEMPPRRVYYTKEQIQEVLRYSDRLAWLLISICYDCGLRISELRNLRLCNIDGRCIRFIGKGYKSRVVYMSEETRARLDEWIKSEKVTDYIWVRCPSRYGRPLTEGDLRCVMRKPFEKAGFNNFYPHALRHSFATNICDNGAPLPVAQKMLGHSSVRTTERYVHTFDDHLKEYFDQYKFAAA